MEVKVFSGRTVNMDIEINAWLELNPLFEVKSISCSNSVGASSDNDVMSNNFALVIILYHNRLTGEHN